MIRGIVKELNLDDKIYKPASLLRRISSAKNSLISAQEYNATEGRIANRPMIGQI